MPRYAPEPAANHGAPRRTAVLLVNLGTPEAPTAPALRRYLKQFLWDPRVVEIPRPVWWLILNGIILNTRPAKSAAKYAKIWLADGSPLKVHTERQAKLLKGWLGEAGSPDLDVAWAMRYGQPSIAGTLDRLKREGVERVLVVPAYPQYRGEQHRQRDGRRRRLDQAQPQPAWRFASSSISTTIRATSLRWPPACASTGPPGAGPTSW
jgi:ferrochelatase